MAYGRMGEGDRVWTAVAGPSSSADINELQDQVILEVKERKRRIITAGYNGTQNAAWNSWDSQMGGVSAADYWESVTANSQEIFFPMNVRVGEVITEVSVEVTGLTGALGGAIWFQYFTAGGGAPTTVDMDGVANCWDTGGTGYGGAVAYVKNVGSGAPFPLTVVDGMFMHIYCASGTNSATHDNRIWDVYYMAQSIA